MLQEGASRCRHGPYTPPSVAASSRLHLGRLGLRLFSATLSRGSHRPPRRLQIADGGGYVKVPSHDASRAGFYILFRRCRGGSAAEVLCDGRRGLVLASIEEIGEAACETPHLQPPAYTAPLPPRTSIKAVAYHAARLRHAPSLSFGRLPPAGGRDGRCRRLS
jgi:hypothetical protein